MPFHSLLPPFFRFQQKKDTDDSIPAKNKKQHYDEKKQTSNKSPETLMNEKQIASHNNRDTIIEAPSTTVFHQQQYKDRNLPTLNSNAKMITVSTSVIDSEQQGVTTDTR